MADGAHFPIPALDQHGVPLPLTLAANMPGEPRLTDELLAGRQRTTALVYATAMLERMDEQILPAVRLASSHIVHARCVGELSLGLKASESMGFQGP